MCQSKTGQNLEGDNLQSLFKESVIGPGGKMGIESCFTKQGCRK